MPTAKQMLQKEKEIKLSIKGEINIVKKFSTGAAANSTNVKLALERCRAYLLELESYAVPRITLMDEGAPQDTELTVWTDYKMRIEQEIISGQTLYGEMPDVHQLNQTQEQLEAQAAQSKLTEARKTADAEIAALKGDFDDNWTDEGAAQMSKLQFATYTQRIDKIKKDVWPGLEKLQTKLVSLDLANHKALEESFTTAQEKTRKAFHEMNGVFLAMKIPEESMNLSVVAPSPGAGALGDPVANSTNLNRSLVSIVSEAGINKGYRSYKNEEPPTFTGEPSDYQLWKREWQNSVVVGRDDAWVIRNIYEHVKVPGDPELSAQIKTCKTQVQVWALLDRVFNNATIVCGKVLEKFMRVRPTDLKNHTPQSQMVHLNLKVQQLILNLEAVKRECQFNRNPMVLNYAIKLLPGDFRTEFSKERQKAERRAREGAAPFEDDDLAQLFLTFVEDYAIQFREYQPETLLPPKLQAAKGKASLQNAFSMLEERDGVGFSPEDDFIEDEEEYGLRFEEEFLEDDPPIINSMQTQAPGVSGDKSPDWGTMIQVKKDWARIGKCPVDKCGQDGHYWTGKKGVFASDQLTDCLTFRRSSIEQRMAVYKKLKLCRRCTSRGHQVAACPRSKEKLFCKKKKADGTECKADHASLFHGGTFKGNHRQGITFLPQTGKESPNSTDVMLAITTVVINGRHRVVVLLDNGSNSTLITHRLAKELLLKGFLVMQEVELCGKDPEMQQVTYYNIRMTMPEGDTISIRLIGVDKITSNPGSYDVSIAYKLFPQFKPPALDKPDGEVELLIGADQIRFMPSGGKGKNIVGNLCVYDIPLPPYVVLMGSHPKISFWNPTLTQAAMQMRTANIYSSVPDRLALPGPVCLNNLSVPADFWEAELLGYNTPKKCNKCRNCTACHITEEGTTVKAQLELQAMKDGITYDEPNKQYFVKYPIVGDITAFKDNRKQAEVRADSLKKSLTKRGLLDAYQGQIDDFIKRGVWKKTSLKEVEEYKASGGSVHYVGHHPVLNPSSTSTPVRLVVDSAMRNNYTGPKLSSLYAKGPNCLNNLYSVLCTWRSYMEAGIFDVSRAYHGMKTGKKEFFMRLVVWKMPGDEHYTIFGHMCVGFGDISASTLLELIFADLAEKGQSIDSYTAIQLTVMRYVDDGLFGGTREQILRMKGATTWSAEGKPSYDGFLTQILAIGSFKVKHIVLSKDQDPKVENAVTGVLGMDWDPAQDTFICAIKVNLSKKLGAGRKLPDLTQEDVEKVQSVVFTRRLALQVASQIWDPLGLLVPYTIKLKICMKELVDHEKAWDEPLVEALQTKWRKLVTDMINTKPITFPRSLTVETAVGRPELVAFFDGSDQAFGAVLYLRYRTADPNTFHTRLVTSKGRVTPKGGITTPRSELSGMVVAVRLCSKIIKALSHTERPVRVTVAGDSKCSVTAVDENCAALNPFFANRTLEVMEAQREWGTRAAIPATQDLSLEELGQLDAADTVVDKVQYLPGPLNPADWPSRGNLEWNQLDLGSEWQCGPAFIAQPRQNWPFNTDFLPTLPAEERRKRFMDLSVLNIHIVNATSNTKNAVVTEVRMLDSVRRVAKKYNCIIRVRGVIARVYRASRMGAIEEVRNVMNQDLRAAEFLLAFVAQLDHQQEILNKRTWDSLAAFWREGLARARGRIGHKPIKNLIGHQDFIILSNKSKLARFIMIAVGDIVVVTHRLARVLAVGPDDHGVVPTVTVGYRPRHVSDRRKRSCIPKLLDKFASSVQRLVVLLAVEEQHLLPAPFPHRHACPGNLNVPACSPPGGQDDEMSSPPTPQPVPLLSSSEVAPKPSQENDLHDAQANFHQQHLLPAPSPYRHPCPGSLKLPACSHAKEQDDEMSSPPLQQPVLQSPSSETAPEPAQESQLCKARRLQTEVAQQL